MRKLLLLILAPSLLWAGQFIINLPSKMPVKSGMVEIDSLRTLHSKVYKLSATDTTNRRMAIIGVAPLHYVDDTGKLQEYNFEASTISDTVYDKKVNVGRFSIEYSTSRPGKFRYARKDAYIEFDPEFSNTEVGIELNINQHGIKANYTLPRGLDSLSWKYSASSSIEAQIGAKGKGKLKDKIGSVRGELSVFTAEDSTGKSLPITAKYESGRLVVRVDAKEAVGFIKVDPSIQDTAVATYSRQVGYYGSGLTWTAARNRTWGAVAAVAGSWLGAADDGATRYLFRHCYSFDFSDLSATSVDSGYMTFTSGSSNYPPVAVTAVKGTFSGTPDSTWYIKFQGWAASGAYTTSNLMTDSISITATNTAYTKALSDSGKAAVLQAAGVGYLRVTFLENFDRLSTPPTPGAARLAMSHATILPYVKVYYSTGTVTGWSKKVAGIVPSKVNGIVPTKVLGIQ